VFSVTGNAPFWSPLLPKNDDDKSPDNPKNVGVKSTGVTLLNFKKGTEL